MFFRVCSPTRHAAFWRGPARLCYAMGRIAGWVWLLAGFWLGLAGFWLLKKEVWLASGWLFGWLLAGFLAGLAGFWLASGWFGWRGWLAFLKLALQKRSYEANCKHI